MARVRTSHGVAATVRQGALAGALALLPVASWALFRALAFNTLSLAGRLELALFLAAVYGAVGAAVGGLTGLATHRWAPRGYLPATLVVVALLGGVASRGRIVPVAGSLATPVLVAGVLLLLTVAFARWVARGRGWGFALGFLAGNVVLLGGVLLRGTGTRVDLDPSAHERLLAAEPSSPPLVVFGIDGAEWSILRPIVERGELPHLGALMDHGAVSPLESRRPTWSPPIWTTIWTGKLPADHGVTFFLSEGVYRLPGRPEGVVIPRLLGARIAADALLARVEVPVSSRMRRATAVWEVAGLAGRRSVLANRLVSWPALPLRGIELTDRLVRGDASVQELSYPDSLAPGVLARLDGAEAPDDPAFAPTPWLARGLARERELWRIAAEMASAEQASLLVVYTHLVDSAQHRYLKYHWSDRFRFEVDAADVALFRDVVAATYREVDAMVGDVLARAPAGSRVLVISDHGVVPNLDLRQDAPEPVGREDMPEAHPSGVSGVHGEAPDGVFILAGPGVRGGPLGRSPSVLDVAPLILSLLGLPAAADMERAPLPERESGILEEYRPQPPVLSYEGLIPRDLGAASSTVDGRILDELRSLGYID